MNDGIIYRDIAVTILVKMIFVFHVNNMTLKFENLKIFSYNEIGH